MFGRLGAWVIVGTCLAAGAIPSPASAQSLFEALFGSNIDAAPRYHSPPRYYDEGRGLGFTVRSRPRSTWRRTQKFGRAEKKLSSLPIHKVVNTAINPAKVPDWYLQDPTLRAGDIIVLRGEVIVFQGGRLPYTRSDFSSLQQSRLSKTEREQIAVATGLKHLAPAKALTTAAR